MKFWPTNKNYFTKTDVKGIIRDINKEEIKKKQAEMINHPSKAIKKND